MYSDLKFKGLYAPVEWNRPWLKIGRVWISHKGIIQCEMSRFAPLKELYSRDGSNIMAQIWIDDKNSKPIEHEQSYLECE
jgi:hypothetical protein